MRPPIFSNLLTDISLFKFSSDVSLHKSGLSDSTVSHQNELKLRNGLHKGGKLLDNTPKKWLPKEFYHLFRWANQI